MLKLGKFSASDVSDALIKLGSPGYLPGIQLQNGSKIFGPVYTVQLTYSSDKDSPVLSHHFADTIVKDSIVLISAPRDCPNAVWGGLMTTRARYLGAKGVVVDGFVRDLEEHQDFPVFARGSSCLGAATFTRACSIQTPITINSSFRYPSIIIQSGDVVIGDRDGVVVVPQHLIEKVVEICQISVEVDSQIMSDLQSGISVEESMKRRR